MRRHTLAATVLLLLLALAIASWPRAATHAQAVPDQKGSILVVGGKYEFILPIPGRESIRVAKVVEVPRPDGWVKCNAGGEDMWINLHHFCTVGPVR